MFRVLADSDGTHRLEDADGTPVGWIRGRRIGLHGLEDEPQALAVAVAAWRALDAALRRQFAGWPRYAPEFDRLRIMHDGVHEWISDGATALARLIRLPGVDARADSFAVEFELPSFASEGIAVTAAQLMGKAFRECVADGARPERAPTHAPAGALPDAERRALAIANNAPHRAPVMDA
jgi:hypothetical protein